MTYQISVIMPALNEQNNIEFAINDVLKAFERLSLEGELVVINDGSTDQTANIVEKIMAVHKNIRLIGHKTPQGIGNSFWHGVQVAKGEVVTMMPGDGENECYETLRYLPLLQDVDIVIPFIYNRNARSLSRRILSKFYKGIINVSFGLLLNYMNGNVMYRKRVLEGLKLQTSGFFYQTELLIKSIRTGYLYAEVPCAINVRKDGESKAVTLKSFFKVAKAYLDTLWAVNFSREKEARYPLNGSVTFARHRNLAKNNLVYTLKTNKKAIEELQKSLL